MLGIIDNLSSLSMSYSNNDSNYGVNAAGTDGIAHIPRIFFLDDDAG